VTGGTLVLVTGKGLTKKSQVFFGAAPAPQAQFFIDCEHLIVQAPSAAAPGTVDVLVKNPLGGEAVILLGGFRYVAVHENPPQKALPKEP
jgi:hypothetical protein